ncbi:MAG: hypothetical protein WC877_00050 [Dehalococcoidales bacterium]|jgi:hypothetical protein
MSLEVLLSLAIKDIGVLTERINSLEACLLNSTIEEEEEINDDSESDGEITGYEHRFTFPISGNVDEDSMLNTQQCRFLQSSMYNVRIFKPFSEETNSPIIITVDMTRDELDDFIAKDPGRNFKEFVISIKPTLEDYL